MITLGDRNNDGRIDKNEFVEYCIEQEKNLWRVFHYMDANRDGKPLIQFVINDSHSIVSYCTICIVQ